MGMDESIGGHVADSAVGMADYIDNALVDGDGQH